MSGHIRSSCFKLIGYPDWHPKSKEKKDSKGSGQGRSGSGSRFNRANVVHTNTDVSNGGEYNEFEEDDTGEALNMQHMIQEMYKMLKGKEKMVAADSPMHIPSDFTAFAGFSGKNNSWYMCNRVEG
ncbi:uncharacterized protein [Euphorbia lathyris]|uniref:uncharacterized protein n=1 Tax=Euphorbia lathyris TaxID=212925 RepID=UPI003313B5B8